MRLTRRQRVDLMLVKMRLTDVAALKMWGRRMAHQRDHLVRGGKFQGMRLADWEGAVDRLESGNGLRTLVFK